LWHGFCPTPHSCICHTEPSRIPTDKCTAQGLPHRRLHGSDSEEPMDQCRFAMLQIYSRICFDFPQELDPPSPQRPPGSPRTTSDTRPGFFLRPGGVRPGPAQGGRGTPPPGLKKKGPIGPTDPPPRSDLKKKPVTKSQLERALLSCHLLTGPPANGIPSIP